MNQKNLSSPLVENRFYNFRAKNPFSKKFSEIVYFDTSVPYGYPKHPYEILAQWLISTLSFDITDFLIFLGKS